MNEKWLSTFVVLADQESFSKAADTLHISQSAVTKHLKALEQKLGVSLIDRDHFTLTEEGKWVYEKASEWLTEWEDLKERCSQRGESWKKTFRIGASTTPGTYFLPKLCSVFIKAYPDIRLSLQVDDSETISSSLKKGDLDMALTGAFHTHPELMVVPLIEDRLAIIGPSNSDKKKITSMEELQHLPFIKRKEGSGTFIAAERGLNEWGGSMAELETAAISPTTESMLSLVEAGIGYGFVSDLALQHEKKRNVGRYGFLPSSRTFYASYLQHGENLQESEAFTKLAKKMLPM
ncbi:selenium metabolism-associated LysR family transcriptional regulator [Thalassorhabdus alkalitolerans]|uniref:Selenium metabolism-associated LysR family transcriptional regulator n=2 Tax=Bacillaceae TaxID=186817 RepID=A0ABW0YKA4_9BACI